MLLNTIIFLRNPKKVTPIDISCVLLAPLTFIKSDQNTVDIDIKKAIG